MCVTLPSSWGSIFQSEALYDRNRDSWSNGVGSWRLDMHADKRPFVQLLPANRSTGFSNLMFDRCSHRLNEQHRNIGHGTWMNSTFHIRIGDAYSWDIPHETRSSGLERLFKYSFPASPEACKELFFMSPFSVDKVIIMDRAMDTPPLSLVFGCPYTKSK